MILNMCSVVLIAVSFIFLHIDISWLVFNVHYVSQGSFFIVDGHSIRSITEDCVSPLSVLLLATSDFSSNIISVVLVIS